MFNETADNHCLYIHDTHAKVLSALSKKDLVIRELWSCEFVWYELRATSYKLREICELTKIHAQKRIEFTIQ